MSITKLNTNLGLLSGLSSTYSSKAADSQNLMGDAMGQDEFSSVFSGCMQQSEGKMSEVSGKSSQTESTKESSKNLKDLEKTSQSGEEKQPLEDTTAVDQSDGKVQDEKAEDLKNQQTAPEKVTNSFLTETDMNNPDVKIEGDELEAIMEVLAQIGNLLLDKTAEVLSVSGEELQAILGEMDVAPSDLVDGTNYQNFLMNAIGAEDSMALLTNEEQYKQFSVLMEEFTAIIEDHQEQIGQKDLISMLITQNDGFEKNEDADTDMLLDMSSKEQPVNSEQLLQSPVKNVEQMPEESAALASDGKESPVQVQSEQANETPNNGNGNNNHSYGNQRMGRPASQISDTDTEIKNVNSLLFRDFTEVENLEEVVAKETIPESMSEQTREIATQIVDFIRSEVREDLSQIEMQLTPANLGTVQIHIASKNGMMTASFIAQDESVKAAMESQIIRLQESLENQGIKVEAIEVSVATHSFEQNLEQNQHREEEQEAQKKAIKPVRRLQLGPDMSLEDLEDLTQEEKLNAEMMLHNGQTVDYQA